MNSRTVTPRDRAVARFAAEPVVAEVEVIPDEHVRHVLPVDSRSVPKGEHWQLRFEQDEWSCSFELAFERMTSSSPSAQVAAVMQQIDLSPDEMRWLRPLLDEAIAACDRQLKGDEDELAALNAGGT
jgi:hypothetical protein